MKPVKLYPPGGGDYVIPHPSKVEEMKAKGWRESPPKQQQPPPDVPPEPETED